MHVSMQGFARRKIGWIVRRIYFGSDFEFELEIEFGSRMNGL